MEHAHMQARKKTLADRQLRHDKREAAAREVIPHGSYCYSHMKITLNADGLPVGRVKPCPFYKTRGDWKQGANGFCRFLKAGDSSSGRLKNGNPLWTIHLHDQVKECGLNDE